MKKNKNGEYKHIVNTNFKHILKPEKFYSVCVDNFFANPDLIRNFGLNLPKTSHSGGVWPGKRSKELCYVDLELNTAILLKVFSVYFDLRYENIEWENSSVCFQQIKKYSNDKNNIKNKGWIHQDSDMSFAGVIYLTPNIDPNSGTSLYDLKENEKENYMTYGVPYSKHLLFKGEKIKEELYKNNFEKHNNKFIEKTRFQNIYNRMICYDSKEFHAANSFFSEGDERLTIIFFVNNIKVKKNPLDRVKDIDSFDNIIEERIKLKNENIKSEEKLPEQTNISDK